MFTLFSYYYVRKFIKNQTIWYYYYNFINNLYLIKYYTSFCLVSACNHLLHLNLTMRPYLKKIKSMPTFSSSGSCFMTISRYELSSTSVLIWTVGSSVPLMTSMDGRGVRVSGSLSCTEPHGPSGLDWDLQSD